MLAVVAFLFVFPGTGSVCRFMVAPDLARLNSVAAKRPPTYKTPTQKHATQIMAEVGRNYFPRLF